MQLSRRVRRSSVPSLALEFLLEAELERHGGMAIALGTLEGVPIAGVGDVEPSRIAAAAAAKLAGSAQHPLPAAFAAQSFRMSVVQLPEGQRVLITSVGSSGLSSNVESGVLRILS